MISTVRSVGEDSEVEGERTLWFTVVNNALDDIAEAKTTSRAVFYHQWFMSSSDVPCSFLWVCSMLGLDKDCVRASANKVLRRRMHNGRIESNKASRSKTRVSMLKPSITVEPGNALEG